MIQKTIFYYSLLLVFACGTPKSQVGTPNAEDASVCKTMVEAKDFSGLDGCQILLITDDGQKLLVGESLPGKSIEAGKYYAIDFEVFEGMASICMAEDKIIRLTCLQEIKKDRPIIKKCYNTEDVFDIPFLKREIEKNQPLRIIRFEFRGGAAYQINGEQGYKLIDCQGNNMCEELGKNFKECFTYFNTDFGASKIIYKGEGPNE